MPADPPPPVVAPVVAWCPVSLHGHWLVEHIARTKEGALKALTTGERYLGAGVIRVSIQELPDAE